jgi:hypothetical protein
MKPSEPSVTDAAQPGDVELLCMCGHRRGDHQGMGPSRGRRIMSACGGCECNQWRPSKNRKLVTAPAEKPLSDEEDKCIACDEAAVGFCENCDAPICPDHEEGQYGDVYTCSDHDSCSRRIVANEAKLAAVPEVTEVYPLTACGEVLHGVGVCHFQKGHKIPHSWEVKPSVLSPEESQASCINCGKLEKSHRLGICFPDTFPQDLLRFSPNNKCKCGHERSDHRNLSLACGAGWIIEGVDIDCDCEDFEEVQPVKPVSPEAESGPANFDAWWNTEPIKGFWKTNSQAKLVAEAAWNAALAAKDEELTRVREHSEQYRHNWLSLQKALG